MASIEERNGAFRVRWRTIAGEPRSRQCPDRRTARTLKAEIERERALGRDWSDGAEGGHAAGLDDLCAAYLIDCARRLAPETVRRRTVVIGVMLDALSPGGIIPGPDALTRDALYRWHAQLVTRVSRRTAAEYLSEAGRLWAWAFDSDEWTTLVSRPRRLDPGSVPGVPRIVGPPLASIDRAIEAARSRPRTEWHARLMVVMRFTGLRAGQVRRLLWSDADLETGRLIIRPELGKSRQEQRGRVVPLHPALVAELAGWGRREGLLLGPARSRPNGSTMAAIWGRADDDPRQPLHGIRHTFTSVLAAAGVPEPVIGALVGHAGTTTRETYIDPAALWSAMAEAVARIPPVGHRVFNLDERRRVAGGGDGR